MNESSNRLPDDFLKWREFSGYFHFRDKKVSADDRQRFMIARNIILYHFSRFDEMLTKILVRYFTRFNSSTTIPHKFREQLLDNLGFERKRQIVKNLGIIKFENQDEELDFQRKIRAVNRIKNAFIRSIPIDSKKYEYNGEHIIYICDVWQSLDRDARKIFDLYCAVFMELDVKETDLNFQIERNR